MEIIFHVQPCYGLSQEKMLTYFHYMSTTPALKEIGFSIFYRLLLTTCFWQYFYIASQHIFIPERQFLPLPIAMTKKELY